MNPDEVAAQQIRRLRDVAPEEVARADQSWARFLNRNGALLEQYPGYGRLLWKTAFYTGHVYSSGDIGVSHSESDTDTH